jgi:carotenoid 1,2-hydratase
VFSPYYAWARRRGPADPENHCALNVALYGASGKRWAMTERGRAGQRRTVETLAIGPSALHWDGAALTINVDEIGMPVPRRVRGTVRVVPSALTGRRYALDPAARHRWSPLAPVAQVEVDLQQPALRWSGPGYLDMNEGDSPLESDFSRWDWCCARTGDGAAVLYDTTLRNGTKACFGLRFDRAGGVAAFEPPPPVRLPRTGWQVARGVRADDGIAAVRRTFEDTPFYARSEVTWRLEGEDVSGMHESLSLDRFRSPVVQAMLPFRMPRRARW